MNDIFIILFFQDCIMSLESNETNFSGAVGKFICISFNQYIRIPLLLQVCFIIL